MFDYQKYNQRFFNSSMPLNGAAGYGVNISPAKVAVGEAYWQVIGVHHLLPLENMSNHHVYFEVLNEQARRVPNARIGWTWVGRGANERADPIVLDKPLSETAGNLAMFKGQIVSVWVAAAEPSDVVSGLSTAHPDEPLPDGRLLNTIGHHSFYVVFRRVRYQAEPPAAPDPAPSRLTLEERVALLESQVARLMKGRDR